jgi:hypothetical protein
MIDTKSKSGARFAWAALAFGAALLLALGAAHWYATPALNGAPEPPFWTERDVLFSLASGALALGVAWLGRGSATRPGAAAAGSFLLRGLLWLSFTLLLLASWAHYVNLLALWLAPTHAFALLRLLALWTSWRSDARLSQPR